MQPAETPFQDAARIVREVREEGKEPFDPETFARFARFHDAVATMSWEDLVFQEYRNEGWKGDNPTWAFVHPSTYVPGRWRYTVFDTLGWRGHEDHYATPWDAMFAMLRAGYAHPQPGILAKLMKTERWRIGIQILDLVGRRNMLYAKGRYDKAKGIDQAISALNEKLQEID